MTDAPPLSESTDHGFPPAEITAITPVAVDPSRRRITVSGRTVATLSEADVEALGLAVGAHWSERLDRAVEECVAADRIRRAALRMLGRRSWSRRTLVGRLVGQGHEPAFVTRIADELEAQDWLDDAAHARAVATETLRGRPAGRPLLQARLERAGIEADLAARVADESLEGRDEVADALSLARRQLERTERRGDGAAATRRIAGLLNRRGFDEDTIATVLDRLDLAEPCP